MAVNLRAPALLGARIGAAMAADGGGSIVNVASLAGLRALTEHYAYSASQGRADHGDQGPRAGTGPVRRALPTRSAPRWC